MLQKRTATYALLAMFEIADQQRGAEHPPKVRACDIAAKYKLPRAYVAKIMSYLANAEILHSDRGPGGGFRLERAPKDITLFDIFEGAGALTPYDKRRDTVKNMPRSVQSTMAYALEESTKSMKKILLGKTLADLLKSK
jgi:Rrf2 family protein